MRVAWIRWDVESCGGGLMAEHYERSATVKISGTTNTDVDAIVCFLNSPDAMEKVHAFLGENKEETIVVDSLRHVGVQDKRQKVKMKDDKPYTMPEIGTIDSLEL